MDTRAAFGPTGNFRIENTSPLVQSIYLAKGKVDVDVRVDSKDLSSVSMHWWGE